MLLSAPLTCCAVSLCDVMCIVVRQLVRAMATESLHRVAVIQSADSRRLAGVVTQSVLVRYVYSHSDMLAPVWHLPAVAYFGQFRRQSGTTYRDGPD